MQSSLFFLGRPLACRRAAFVALVLLSAAAFAGAQEPQSLTAAAARTAARRASPELAGAREAAAAARARERQAAAYPNPTLAFSREQASGAGQSGSQDIAVLEQPIEFGLRSARRDAFRLRREAAEARVLAAESQLDYEVTRVFALVVAADRRAALSAEAASAFEQARRVADERLAAGDISGYEHRRLRLEVARYAAARAEAELARHAARVALAALVATDVDATGALTLTLADPAPETREPGVLTALLAQAQRTRAEIRAAELDAEAAAAEARLASRERIPMPSLAGGIKRERLETAPGQSVGLSGLALGLSLPLPLWDRRAGAVAAAEADTRQRRAEVLSVQRLVAREVTDAYEAYRAARAQVVALEPHLGPESRAALGAAAVAYTEGEISLVEWLDAARAYQEAESSLAALRAELHVRFAALQRAVGVPLSTTSITGGAAAPKE